MLCTYKYQKPHTIIKYSNECEEKTKRLLRETTRLVLMEAFNIMPLSVELPLMHFCLCLLAAVVADYAVGVWRRGLQGGHFAVAIPFGLHLGAEVPCGNTRSERHALSDFLVGVLLQVVFYCGGSQIVLAHLVCITAELAVCVLVGLGRVDGADSL